jgi:hypothetical protein
MYVSYNTEAHLDPCILDTSHMVVPFNSLYSNFMLLYKTVNVLLLLSFRSGTICLCRTYHLHARHFFVTVKFVGHA